MYTTLERLPNGNLKFQLTEDGKDEMEVLKIRFNDDDRTIFLELIEQHLCNGYHVVDPARVGALTEALIISDTSFDDEATIKEMKDATIWWYPNYQVLSYLHKIDEDGVEFTLHHE